MTDKRDFQCTAVALLFAWVTFVFLPSALIALLGLSYPVGPSPGGLAGLLAETWEVADEVGPLAKLLIVALFAALVLPSDRLRLGSDWHRHALRVAVGVGAMVLALGLVPEALSRGFGVGLTGTRFDPSVLPVYLLGGAAGGAAYTASVTACR